MNKHVFRNSVSKQSDAAKRVATYYRVSTGRQYANEASIPSQRKITASFCDQNGYVMVEEFVEAKTATDDRRPVLQDMIERACAPDHPYDAIVFYAFNRFFRNVAEMELTIRKLRKHGVEVVSVTQPTGDDPSQILVRQIIGTFDEHTSREISKNTTRAMRESAKQGFWNGATPPLGYKIVEAERRGQKIKKKLDIDAVEAETVRLIFKLYLDGDGATGPLGVKETTKWLNSHGYRTRRGATFGVGPVHKILTNACYSTGQWPYGVRSSRDGRKYDPSTVIHIPVPVLIERGDFDRVQAKLARSNPKTTPPRVVNGPSLLTGIAVCASCGSGMTRTGTTNRQGRSYSYYSCAGCQQKGKTVCKGRHVPAATLDEIVLTNLKQRVLAPDRIALIERQTAKNESADDRLLALQKELTDCEDRMKRLYRSIEDGIVELDDILRERTAALKAQRERAKAALDHARAQMRHGGRRQCGENRRLRATDEREAECGRHQHPQRLYPLDHRRGRGRRPSHSLRISALHIREWHVGISRSPSTTYQQIYQQKHWMSAHKGRTSADVERSRYHCKIGVIVYFGGRRRMLTDVGG